MNPFGFTFCKCKSTSIVAQMRWLALSSKRCKIVSRQGWRIDLWGLSSQKIVSVESRQRQIQRQRQNWAKQPVYYSRWGSKAVLREDARQASRRLERESFHCCRHAPESLDIILNFNYLQSSFFFAFNNNYKLHFNSSTSSSASTPPSPPPHPPLPLQAPPHLLTQLLHFYFSISFSFAKLVLFFCEFLNILTIAIIYIIAVHTT